MASCLLIDDSRLARRVCRALLEANGLAVSEANDGVEGLERMAVDAFDLILVDQFMPRLNGVDFIRACYARRNWQSVPILLCSSDAAPELVRLALSVGASGYLNKPYTAAALHRRLQSLQLAPA